MTYNSSQVFESFLPVFDAIPDKFEDAKSSLTEELKMMANAVNSREIGYYLDEELLSGKQLFPGVPTEQNNKGQIYRQILRKVIDFGGLPVTPPDPVTKSVAHGITVDANFTLVQIWGAATSPSTGQSIPIPFTEMQVPALGNIQIIMGPKTIDITVAPGSNRGIFTRTIIVIEYTQEL